MTLTEINLNKNEKISSREEIEKEFPSIKNFLDFFDKHYVITKSDKGVFRVYLFTDNYEYDIVVYGDYCGGFTTVRKRGIMERWDRGNDIIDGKPNEQIFTKLALYMFRNELIQLGDIEFKPFDEVYGGKTEETEKP